MYDIKVRKREDCHTIDTKLPFCSHASLLIYFFMREQPNLREQNVLSAPSGNRADGRAGPVTRTGWPVGPGYSFPSRADLLFNKPPYSRSRVGAPIRPLPYSFRFPSAPRQAVSRLRSGNTPPAASFLPPSLLRIRICSDHVPAAHPAELVRRSILTRKCHNSVVLTTRESAIVPIKDRRRAASPIVGNTPKLALGL